MCVEILEMYFAWTQSQRKIPLGTEIEVSVFLENFCACHRKKLKSICDKLYNEYRTCKSIKFKVSPIGKLEFQRIIK